MPTKYIGLTIGPIHRTMTRTKATRELWASSYIFSYIMKKMIEKLKDNTEFIIPYTKDQKIFEQGQEVGLFHDRFIFKAQEGDFEEVGRVKEKVLKKLSADITAKINEENQNKVFEFLNKYFQIYYCEVESDGDYNKVNNKVNAYLDSLELQEKFISEAESNYLRMFLDRVNKSFLIQDAYGENRHRFPCIAEIAALRWKDFLDWTGIDPDKMYKKDSNDTDDSDIYTKLKKQNEDEFKQYHKYIAIVQADGDSLGATIKELKNDDDFGIFSKKLLEFSQNAHKMIKDYGGTTIFAGGDDLLFFAPVVSKKSNVFQLVDELAKEFVCHFKEFVQTPTLSTGVSITYYKYPMGEALESAANLLFKKAKDKKMGKNALAYEVQKHSGQRIAGVFNRADADYKEFVNLVFGKGDKRMLTSLIHKLAIHGAIIDEIGSDQIKLKNYFEHFFNEDEHKKHRDIINATENLVNSVFNNCKRTEKEKKENIFSVLRLKKFLEGGE